MFNINKFKSIPENISRYNKHIQSLKNQKISTEHIEEAVTLCIQNIKDKNISSFVIYGEPQSGKTEMMISLTAKLLDNGYKLIIVLLNDNVQLLNQNLSRFRRSGIDPAAKNFSEIMDPIVKIGETEWIIFCKKNPNDLHKLIDKLSNYNHKVILDDEADYATPNSKINIGDKTKINRLIGELIGKDGKYIGVTATPARLDLNNTFENANDSWVQLLPHVEYTGQDYFFPMNLNEPLQFNLNILPDSGDNPEFLRQALFSFFINVAYLNQIAPQERNYCMLIHTSGKRADHTEDYKQVVKVFNILKNVKDTQYEKYVKNIWEVAEKRYTGNEDIITEYILKNISRNVIVVMNSDVDKRIIDYTNATSPSAIFTIAIGGNIISRGVTFDNLLSMFFTRDVKHKIQQDTYIQRARMFGNRNDYLHYFELSIPEKLYLDWHKCFVFHRLSLESIRTGSGSPIWLEDNKVRAVSNSSIDKTTVSMDSGEMSFEIFDYDKKIEDIILNNSVKSFPKLDLLRTTLGSRSLPDYLISFIQNFSPYHNDSLCIHHSNKTVGYSDADQENIERAKGFIGNRDLELDKFPNAIHHIKIFYNNKNSARLFYKYVGNIRFLKNLKKS